MKRPVAALVLLSLALAPVATRADGGMWMPQQMVDLAPRLKKLGFQGNPKAFADLTGMPMGAIVSLGGCSASFVSDTGLIITNHHCVTGALQYIATPERNTVKEGYLAATLADETWAGPGSRVLVTVAVREITKDVVGKLPAEQTDLDRELAIEKRTKELTAACEKEGLRCRVASFFEGLKWFEIAPGRAEGRPARLRSALDDRELRRRDRQLALAPPHRRLRLLPGLRGQGRQARGVRQGQRPVQAQAPPHRGPGRREPRRRRGRGRLPRADRPPRHCP